MQGSNPESHVPLTEPATHPKLLYLKFHTCTLYNNIQTSCYFRWNTATLFYRKAYQEVSAKSNREEKIRAKEVYQELRIVKSLPS